MLTHWKNPDGGRDWGQEEKGTTEDEMAGWHHQLDGHEFESTPSIAEVVSCFGLLVQSRCGEGGALQTNLSGLCVEHSQCSDHTGFAPHWVCPHTGFARAHGTCATLLRLQAAL